MSIVSCVGVLLSGALFTVYHFAVYRKMARIEIDGLLLKEIEKQRGLVLSELEREHSPRTQGYSDVLEWVEDLVKKGRRLKA
jgi:hypothetical protein